MSRKLEPQLIDLSSVKPRGRGTRNHKGLTHRQRKPNPKNKYERKFTRETNPEVKWCGATTNAGTDCPNRAPIVTLRGKRYQLKTCPMHAPVPIKRELGLLRSGPGRPKIPTPTEVAKQRIEADVARYLKPFEDALERASRAVVVGNGASAHIEFVEDLKARMDAANSLLDRVYGKSKQAVEVSGGNAPIEIEIPSDTQRQRDVASILAESGALGPALTIPENASAAAPSQN